VLTKLRKEDLNGGKNISHSYSWVRIFNIIRISIPPKSIYRFNIILIKDPEVIAVYIAKYILKFI
jgi:hypothetical protein